MEQLCKCEDYHDRAKTELVSLKKHAFKHGDTKSKPYSFDVDDMEKYFTFMKFDDKLKLLPGQSCDKP